MMPSIIKELKVTEQINVGTFKVEVNNELTTQLIKFDNGEVKVRYSYGANASYLTPPIPKEHAKLVWQKAQQQQK
jgi:hypothetical protein